MPKGAEPAVLWVFPSGSASSPAIFLGWSSSLSVHRHVVWDDSRFWWGASCVLEHVGSVLVLTQ